MLVILQYILAYGNLKMKNLLQNASKDIFSIMKKIKEDGSYIFIHKSIVRMPKDYILSPIEKKCQAMNKNISGKLSFVLEGLRHVFRGYRGCM